MSNRSRPAVSAWSALFAAPVPNWVRHACTLVGCQSVTAVLLLGIVLSRPARALASPVATLSSDSLEFGNRAADLLAGYKCLTLADGGDSDLVSYRVSITGTNPLDFGVLGGPVSGSLAAGKQQIIWVGFAPLGLGPHSASLSQHQCSRHSPCSGAFLLWRPSIDIVPCPLLFSPMLSRRSVLDP